jgi:hypothetical protein
LTTDVYFVKSGRQEDFNMSTKLTLRLDDRVIKKAKKKARARGVSLSRMVEDYFKSVAEIENQEIRESPVLYEIAGVLSCKTGAKKAKGEEPFWGRVLKRQFLIFQDLPEGFDNLDQEGQ